MRALSPVSTCWPATLRISCENTAGSSAPPVLISLAGGKEIFWATSWSWTIPLMNPLPQKAKPAQKPSTSTRITWRLTILHRSPLFTSRPPCCSGSCPLGCSPWLKSTRRVRRRRRPVGPGVERRGPPRGGPLGPSSLLERPERPQLEGPEPRHRVPGRDLDRLVEVRALDDVESGEVLLGLRVRAVRDGELAVADSDGGAVA